MLVINRYVVIFNHAEYKYSEQATKLVWIIQCWFLQKDRNNNSSSTWTCRALCCLLILLMTSCSRWHSCFRFRISSLSCTFRSRILFSHCSDTSTSFARSGSRSLICSRRCAVRDINKFISTMFFLLNHYCPIQSH